MEQRIRIHTVPMVLVLGIANIPLLFTLPVWVSLWCLTLWGYAVAAHVKSWPWPDRILRSGLTIVGCFLAFFFLGQGVAAGGSVFVGLLAIMAGLKPLENEGHRDRMVTLFLVYFTIVSSLFVIENLMTTLYMFFSVFITTACLVHFNHPHRPVKEGLRLSAIIMAQSIPIMIVLFIFFPRLEGTFLNLHGSGQARTGFSETLAPGVISRLVKDDTIAFRVEFQGELPLPEELYWRGLVLLQFDGRTWESGTTASRIKRHIGGKRAFTYTISLEPHRKRYLVALDLPVMAPAFTRLLEDYSLLRRWPLERGFRYSLKSYTDATADSLPVRVPRALQLPDEGNEKSRALAQKWLDKLGSPERIVRQAMEYLKSNNFQYTLNPPLLHKDPVDTFLFESRQGYCEHYASAFAFLMRAAGIPARVVVGYLGGERNPYGDYLIIRQYHAHAWTEVFLKEKGWVRMDPTLIVAPQRTSMNLTEFLASEDVSGYLSRPNTGRLGLFWQKALFIWDSINLRWSSWFMEYSRSEQMGLWSQMWRQMNRHKTWMAVLAVVLSGMITATMLIRFSRTRNRSETDPVAAAYHMFCRKLEKAGIKREVSQGPRDFGMQVAVLRSDLKQSVNDIIHGYINLRYAENGDENSAKIFIRKVKSFRPKRAA